MLMLKRFIFKTDPVLVHYALGRLRLVDQIKVLVELVLRGQQRCRAALPTLRFPVHLVLRLRANLRYV